MLRDEVARYTELSGNDGLHTPIGIIGAYLDGYEKGRTDAQPKLDENTLSEQQESDKLGVKTGETCTDCISRQAAIEAICEHGTRLERRGITVLAVANHKQATVDLLESLPSAQPERCEDCRNFNKARLLIPQPERKEGKWIYLNGLDAFECSVCGRQMVRNIFDYCPWCGARMNGGDDGGET